MMINSKKKFDQAPIPEVKGVAKLISVLAAGWTVVLLLSFIWALSTEYQQTFDILNYQTRVFFEEIVTTRSWNASHGGVYVPVTEKIKPNPYLVIPDRDVTTLEGLKLTKINPAYMTRQIGELASKRNKVWFHITSSKPIRPKNAPDKWEAEQLALFENGVTEFAAFVETGDGKKLFRYMAPLRTDSVCLKCHASQGYKEGFIRGGISVSFDAAPVLDTQATSVAIISLLHFIIWMTGFVSLLFAGSRLKKDSRIRASIEVELRHEKEKLAVTLFSIGEGVITTDINGDVQLVNAIAQELTGWAQGEASGRHLTEILNVVDTVTREKYPDLVDSVIKSGVMADITAEVLLISRDENESNMSLNSAPIKDEADIVIGAVIVFRDITKEKQVAVKIARMQRINAIGTLAGGIAHDFNNILYPITGFAEISLDDLPDNHAAVDNLNEILVAAEKGKELVEQILAFSGQGTPEVKPLHIQPLLKGAIHLLTSTIPKNVQITEEITSEPIIVLGVAIEVSDIIINILMNAYHAVEKTGGTINVALTLVELSDFEQRGLWTLKPGRYACIIISDTGCGISPEIINHIFDPYYTTRRIGEGSGLGLTIAHGNIKKAGGSIDVESEPGKGSTFEVLLPEELQDENDNRS